MTGFNKICVNAIDYCDIKVFAVALYRAMAQGKTFLFRTAAGLVKVLGGVSDIPLLSREDMVTTETQSGGVVVVGSHTQKTTAQLEELLQLDCTVPVAFNSDLVLQGDDALYAEVIAAWRSRKRSSAPERSRCASRVASCSRCRTTRRKAHFCAA